MVSIILPVYNVVKYIKDCLESILCQTYPDYEVIMVNDGSTDGSERICREFAIKDRRFHLINQENAGVCAARSRGVQESRGDLISFIDPDDTIEADFIEKLCDKLRETGADIAQCDRSVNGIKEHPQWVGERLFTKEEIMPGYLKGDFYNSVCLKMYKKNLIWGIPFPDGRPIMEDAAWTAWVFEKCNSIIRIPNSLYHYRMVPTSLTHIKLSEEKECGRFRNLVDKAITIERNIKDKESYINLNNFVLDFLPWTLGSHANLMLFNTYEGLRCLVRVLCSHGFESWIYDIIMANTDFRKAQNEYFRREFFHGRNKGFIYRLKIFWRRLKYPGRSNGGKR